MSLEEAVELVLFAFQNAAQGDIFVQKAPASTIGDLAQAVKELFHANNPLKIIGTRHGEKLYETLVTREEMARSEDMGNYFRIPCDTRDLNYDKYFENGQEKVSIMEDYHSHNTYRLTKNEMIELLLKLDEFKNR